MRVLLATDGSNDATSAAEWLKAFPLPEDVTVFALSVAQIPTTPVPLLTLKELRDAVLADAHRIITETRTLLAPRWPEAEVRVSEGDPREEILTTAEEWKADLIVLGARGLGAFKGFLLGSVSQAVTRHAHCPVLVVKGHPGPLKGAVIAVDGSPDSLHAVEFFSSLPLQRAFKIVLLGVVKPFRFPSTAPGFIRGPLKAAQAELHQEWEKEMAAILAHAASSIEGKVDHVDRLVTFGNPGEEIVSTATAQSADLIVVGARGLGEVSRLLLGSVSEKVLSSSRGPVLVVKHPKKK